MDSFFHLLETVGSGGSKKYLRCGLFGNLMSVAVDPYKLAVGRAQMMIFFRFRFFRWGKRWWKIALVWG